jgi:hypothetical protein
MKTFTITNNKEIVQRFSILFFKGLHEPFGVPHFVRNDRGVILFWGGKGRAKPAPSLPFSLARPVVISSETRNLFSVVNLSVYFLVNFVVKNPQLTTVH